jgi:hypothetical protein
MVITGNPSILDNCSFDGCIWHVNVLLHDYDQSKALLDMIVSLLGSIPRPLPPDHSGAS